MLQPHRKVSCLTSYIFLYEEKREMATVSAKIFCPAFRSLRVLITTHYIVHYNCELFITKAENPQSFLRSAVVRIDIFLPRQSNIHIMPKSAYLFHGFSAFYFTAVVEPEDQDSIVSDGNPVD